MLIRALSVGSYSRPPALSVGSYSNLLGEKRRGPGPRVRGPGLRVRGPGLRVRGPGPRVKKVRGPGPRTRFLMSHAWGRAPRLSRSFLVCLSYIILGHIRQLKDVIS